MDRYSRVRPGPIRPCGHWQFHTFAPHNPKNAASLSTCTVPAILEDREEIIWGRGTYSKLNRLDLKSQTFARYQHDPDDSTT